MLRHTLALLACLCLLSPAAFAQDTPEKPAIDCLPEGTVFAVHVPDGRGFAEAMRQRTQFGAAMFSREKLDRFFELIKGEAGDDWDQMVEDLARYDLSTDDFKHLFDGPAGLSMASVERLDPQLNPQPLLIFIAWMEPGEDLAARLHEAILRSMEDEAREQDEEFFRIDFDAAGHTVSHVTIPEQALDFEQDFELPENFFEMTEAQREAHWEKQQKRIEEAEMIEMDRTHLMLVRMGGRLAFVMAPPQAEEAVRNLRSQDPEAEVPWDELTGVAETTRVVTSFIEAHGQDGRGFAGRVMSVPGIESATTPGDVAVDVLIDLDPLLKMLELAVRQEADGDAEAVEAYEKFMRFSGVTENHVGLYRMSLDQTILRGGLFFAAERPREGLLAMLDQPTIESEPPAWVAADTMGYVHASFDLADAYARIKELAIEVGGEEAQAGFMQVEAGVSATTGVTLPELLKSFGTRHTILNFGMTMIEVEQPDFEAEPDPNTGQWPTKKVELPQQSMAMIWQIQDEALWQRLMQLIGNFAAMGGGAVQPAEEQGFTGYRLDQGGIEMGLMLGKGHLVYGIGPGVTERVLTMIRNTPEPDNQLRNSERFKDAQQLLDLRPAMVFSLEDSGKNLSSTLDMIFRAMEQSGEIDDPELFNAIRDLLPTAEELEGMVSTNSGVVYMTDEGLVAGTALRLTPAE
ncbi:MAG: hypothetical protein GVY24_06150 [Planctomycetes bacterium]|nr:hypothetical protein [Planctomycetota bacterium]